MPQTINIAVIPKGSKDQLPFDTLAPNHIELRNGKKTSTGSWQKRPGYATWKDLSVNESIRKLIPNGVGYAITDKGRVFRIDTLAELTGTKLLGSNRIQWDVFDNKIILCDGSQMMYIDTDTNLVHILGGDPPRAKFITRVGNYTLLSGHDPTEIVYSGPGTPEDYSAPDGGTFDLQERGESLRNMKSLRSQIYFFKDKHIEVFNFVGGSNPFVRMDGAWISQGCGADYSVVEAKSTFFWYGDDRKFYVMSGASAKEISTRHYNREIEKLNQPSQIYGIHFPSENLVRWFAPSDGKCFVYDYINDIFSEDNSWSHGQYERLPIRSFMHYNNKNYLSDWDPNGLIYEWSHDYYDDNGEPIRVQRVLRVRPSPKGNRVRFDALRFRFNRGLSTSNDENRLLMVRVNPDERGWGKYRYIDLGATGHYRPSVDIKLLGAAREMQIEMVETDAVEHVMTHLELTMQELGN